MFSCVKWCEENIKDARGSKVLFGNGEFKVSSDSCTQICEFHLMCAQVVVWGEGVQEEENIGETFLWQMVWLT